MEKEIMVKVCSECGIVNSETAEKCESCGEKLDAPIKNSEADRLNEQIVKRNEKNKRIIDAEKSRGYSEGFSDIPLTPAHIVIGVIACLTALSVIVIMILFSSISSSFKETNELIVLDFNILIALVIAILYCFVPGKMWLYNHWTDKLYYKDPQPSEFAVRTQLFIPILLVLLGIAVVVMQLTLIFHFK